MIGYVECDLCGMMFSKDFPDLADRLNRHTEFHNPIYKGKSREHNGEFTIYKRPRNTVMGKPNYKEVNLK